MDPDAVAPMIVMVTLIVTTGGVLVLRPIAKHLGAYLRALTEQTRLPAANADTVRIAEALSSIEERLTAIEDRQRFADDLLTGRDTAPLIARSSRTD